MQEFKHSVKVPRNYKLAATILKKALTEGASVKSLVFEDKLKHFRTNVLYALISEAIKHNAEIDKLFASTEILKHEPRLDPWLAKVLAVELLYGKKGLPGKSKPEQTVASYKPKFEQYSSENPDHIQKKGVRRPRYVRVNTNLLTTSDAIRAFQEEEYRFVRCTSGSYADYLEQVQQLGEYDFMQDYHVKTVFVFAPGTKLHEHPLYLENKIILQDKATAMAVQLLAPPPGSVVLDMCAAPGMKTTQLAAYMKNQGRVYAVERNEERYKTLCDFVEKTGSTCVETIHKDALEIKRGELSDVEYILLDPSCSGSGMDLCGHSYIEDARLARLTSLQEKFLKHAMNAFPKVKKIVYSTCSILSQENERVVTNVVSQNRIKWNVLNVKELLKDQWTNFGTGMYGSMGARCMYARPESDLTTGFFLAVLEKDAKYFASAEEQEDTNETNTEKDREGSKKSKKNSGNTNENAVKNSVQKSQIQKESKKDDDTNTLEEIYETLDFALPKKKKSKKQNYNSDLVEVNEESANNSPNQSDVDKNKVADELQKAHRNKKSKKDRKVDSNMIEENDIPLDADVIQEHQPKKKNKRSKKDRKGDSKTVEENEITLDADVQQEHRPKKKNKRSKKDRKVDSNVAEENDISLDTDVQQEHQPKKKKKDNKNILNEDQQDDRKTVDNMNDPEEIVECEIPKKKKKKHVCDV